MRTRERLSAAIDVVRGSFGFLSGLAMLLGLVLGLALPALDALLDLRVPVFSFDSQSSARSLLEAIATSTVSVAGLSFSVTVVAFTLASSQLSPRVLRTFRADRLSQTTLALLLGTFIYSLTLLVRLGVSKSDAEPPNLSITLAVLLALGSFLLFATFIAHIVNMLQPSSVVAAIRADAQQPLAARYPSGAGEPADPDAATARAQQIIDSGPGHQVRSDGAGYLTQINLAKALGVAESTDALIRQTVAIGDYVTPGQLIAETWPRGSEQRGQLEAAVRSSFALGPERSMMQDIRFPIRQLADIALKGLSPGINDPTTAENAMDVLATLLVEFTRTEPPCEVRVDADGAPRMVSVAPQLGDLVREGFEQPRIFGSAYPVVSKRLLELLEEVERAAKEQGLSTTEVDRQRTLIAAGAGSSELTDQDVREVRAAASPRQRSEDGPD